MLNNLNFLKKIRYFFEFLIVKFSLFVFYILGLKIASNFGSFLARKIGKRLPVQKLAKKNISLALPFLKQDKINNILDEMWDNLGRIVGEFIHCCKLEPKEIVNFISADKKTLENINYIKENYHGGIIFSGHIGNWEVGSKFFLHHDINVKSFYRPLNNVAVDNITSKARNIDLIEKNTAGNKKIIREIKKGNYIIILIDQRSGGGIRVPFFHKKALTSPSIAKLALKYNIPVIPARIIRINKEFKFKIEVEEALQYNKEGSNLDDKVYQLTLLINKKLESWIAKLPAQWFWVHDRWKN